jgi:hypothetical protein
MDQLRFVQAVDGLGQGVVVAVTSAADRRLDTGLHQPLRLANGDILRSSVGVVNQGIRARLAKGLQRLLEDIQHEVGGHGLTDAPAHDAPDDHVVHKGHVQPALPGRDRGEVRHPELVGTIGLELPINPI